MVLGSSQISKRTVLVFRVAMDILDNVASLVDICHAAMDNVHHLNKFSHTGQNCKSAHSQVEYLNTFSRSHLTLIDRPIHCHYHHRQRPLTMNL